MSKTKIRRIVPTIETQIKVYKLIVTDYEKQFTGHKLNRPKCEKTEEYRNAYKEYRYKYLLIQNNLKKYKRILNELLEKTEKGETK